MRWGSAALSKRTPPLEEEQRAPPATAPDTSTSPLTLVAWTWPSWPLARMSPLTVWNWASWAVPSQSMSPLTLLQDSFPIRDSWPRKVRSPLTVSAWSSSAQPSHSRSPLADLKEKHSHWGRRPSRSPLAVLTDTRPKATSPERFTSPSAVDTRMNFHQRLGKARLTSAEYSPRRKKKAELAVLPSWRMVSTPSSERKASSSSTSPRMTTSPSSASVSRMFTSPDTCTSKPVRA